jgi:hypothetical protein
MRIIAGILFLSLLSACGSKTNETGTETKNTSQSTICEGSPEIAVYCGFENPEDLVIMPGGAQLLVSEMGEFQVHGPSGLTRLDLATGRRMDLDINWQPDLPLWGASDCPAPDTELFSPHGIDLIQRQDGAHQLLAVNHGGRESVEFFELRSSEDASNAELLWRGCAVPPGDPFINDVSGLKDGGFFVTHMWDKSTAFPVLVAKLLAGTKTGWVYEWQPEQGFTLLESSVELMPNGIAVSEDNSKIFVNIYMGNKTIRIDRETGLVDGEFEVQQPDNITVDETGQLWVASHRHNAVEQTCTEPGVCLLPFAIVRADPVSLESEVVLEHEGAPMGYSTVALKVGEQIFMGSAHGDRIASFKVSD